MDDGWMKQTERQDSPETPYCYARGCSRNRLWVDSSSLFTVGRVTTQGFWTGHKHFQNNILRFSAIRSCLVNQQWLVGRGSYRALRKNYPYLLGGGAGPKTSTPPPSSQTQTNNHHNQSTTHPNPELHLFASFLFSPYPVLFLFSRQLGFLSCLLAQFCCCTSLHQPACHFRPHASRRPSVILPSFHPSPSFRSSLVR